LRDIEKHNVAKDKGKKHMLDMEGMGSKITTKYEEGKNNLSQIHDMHDEGDELSLD
jgi:hypothetical protein